MDDDTPLRPEDARTLRFLKLLVTTLTATMIAGMAVLVVLFATRFPATDPAAPPSGTPITVALPDSITLPPGESARAVTLGSDWIAVVTERDEILILDRATGALRQRVAVRAAGD
jgi:hypothetical protein